MTDGLILLGFIAIVITVIMTRIRRRIGLAVRPGFYAATIAGIAIAVLIVWVGTGGR